MPSALISAEITSTCNALGDANKSTKYILGPHCKESAKDLIKYLRRDDETNSIRRQLGDTNIVQTDLIPIIVYFGDNEELFDVILRLLVNLTTPAMILYNEELPTDKVERQLYQQIIAHLQKYKVAFANEAFWKILRTKLTSILNMPPAERTEEKSLVAERIIILIRNVLQIPTDPETELCCHDNPNSHDTVVYILNQAGMLDILIYLAMTPDESHYYLHLLEIMMLMLKEQEPESLAKSDRTRTSTEKHKDETELKRIRDREVKEKMDRLMKYSSRHSRFGGTYVVKGVKGIGENDVLVHKPITHPEDITFDKDKNPTKTPKNRAPLKESRLEHRSPLSVRIILRGFCEEFLAAYNNVMRSVRESITRHAAQSNDETYYLWTVGFFMSFNRHVGLQVGLISETMGVSMFHFLQTQIDTYLCNMTMEKKKLTLWSRRIHIALTAYKEMVLTLLAMISSPDPSVRRSADTIQSNIFYILEYREMVLILFHAYQDTKFSKEFVRDLLETSHVFLKMLEHSCKHRKLVIQKKVRARKPKKNKKSGQQSSAKSSGAALTFTDEEWSDISVPLSAIMQQPELTLPPTVPFDAASDQPIDDQRLGALSTMKRMLKKGQYELALSLLRSSREVWPENDVFGSMSCPPEEELLILREIYLTSVLQPKDIDEDPAADPEEGREESDSENEEEEEERALQSHNMEQSFQFLDFMKKFLHQNVIKALSHLLAQFDLNSDYTNHCLVKMMHRIAVDCKMPAILFQASVFRTFQKMLQKEEPRFKELTTFAKFIVRKFLATAARNRHVFMELLFWKTTKDAYEIEEGYNVAPPGSRGGAMGGVWAEHEEDELRRLFMEHEINHVEQDKVDWILDNLINKERTRKSVIKKLKELYLIVSTKDLKSSVRIKPPANWTEEEEDQLRTIYQQVKDFHDPMNALRDRMQYKRSKGSVLEKLLELRIIQHKSQMYKKRQRRPQGGTAGRDGFDSPDQHNSSSSSSSSDSESDTRSFRHHAAGSFTSPHLVASIRSLLDKGSREIVQWVKEGLEETLEDVDDDETDVPLVPVQESTQVGIEQEDVVSMLTELGLKRPRENMEVYWRIPGVWNSTALKKRIDFLGKLLNNEDPLEGLPPSHLETSDYSDDNDAIESRTPASPSRREPAGGANEWSEGAHEFGTREVNAQFGETPLLKHQKLDKKKKKVKKHGDGRSKSAGPIGEDSDSSDFGDLGETQRTDRSTSNAKNTKSAGPMGEDSDSSDFGDLGGTRRTDLSASNAGNRKETSFGDRYANRSGNTGLDSSGEDTPRVNKSWSRIESDSDDLGVPNRTLSQRKSHVRRTENRRGSGKIDLTQEDSSENDDGGRSGNIDLTKDSSDSDGRTAGKSSRMRPKEKSATIHDGATKKGGSAKHGSTNADAKKASKKKRVVVIDSSDSDNETVEAEANVDSDDIEENLEPRRETGLKRRKPVVISSESEDEQVNDVDEKNAMDVDDPVSNLDEDSATRNDAMRHKKTLTIDSDSDSEHEMGAFQTNANGTNTGESELNSETQDIVNISLKETIRLDSETPLIEVASTRDSELTDIASGVDRTSKRPLEKLMDSEETPQVTDEDAEHNAESENSSLVINGQQTKTENKKQKHVQQSDKRNEKGSDINTETDNSKRRPSELYSSDEEKDEIVNKVKRRKVIIEDDDEED